MNLHIANIMTVTMSYIVDRGDFRKEPQRNNIP